MRSLLLVAAAVAALVAGGWYVVELMPRDAVAAASITNATAAVAPAASHPQQIRSVRLDGDRLPLTILGAMLTTKVGGTLDQSVLDADRQALRDALVARGFWAADVGPAEVVFGDGGGAHVSFAVDPGPVFHVRTVTLAGDTIPTLDEAVTLTAGDDVTPQRLARNAELLASHLARHGRPGALVAVETTTDKPTRSVDIRFVVTRAAR